MKHFKLFGRTVLSWGEDEIINDLIDETALEHKTVKTPIVPPGGRISQPNVSDFTFDALVKDLKIVQPKFLFEAIPVIRKLSMV